MVMGRVLPDDWLLSYDSSPGDSRFLNVELLHGKFAIYTADYSYSLVHVSQETQRNISIHVEFN